MTVGKIARSKAEIATRCVGLTFLGINSTLKLLETKAYHVPEQAWQSLNLSSSVFRKKIGRVADSTFMRPEESDFFTSKSANQKEILHTNMINSWEGVSAILWYLGVQDQMPKVDELHLYYNNASKQASSRYADLFQLTKVQPLNPSTAFEFYDRITNSTNYHCASFDQVEREVRCLYAWVWRCLIFHLEKVRDFKQNSIDTLDLEDVNLSPSIRRLLGNLDRGIKSASALCLNDGLIRASVDNDFALHDTTSYNNTDGSKHLLPFRNASSEVADECFEICVSRLQALCWIQNPDMTLQDGWNKLKYSGTHGLSSAVQAIWKS